MHPECLPQNLPWVNRELPGSRAALRTREAARGSSSSHDTSSAAVRLQPSFEVSRAWGFTAHQKGVQSAPHVVGRSPKRRSGQWRGQSFLWRPLTRSAGRACVGPGSGGAVGDKLPSEGLSQWFHQCVLLQRGEGRGIETHTPNRSSEG